ncbi:hypothetical protein GGF32_003272 [Allomyces javanicus]|nr:hypothetical protein GGF32_003272 [Allomyces javanicus]
MGDVGPSTPPDMMPFPNVEQEKAMTFLLCCIKEVMGLYLSFTSLQPRFTTADVMLHDGTVLPKDTLINADIYLLHHARNVWGPDANVFNPDRASCSACCLLRYKWTVVGNEQALQGMPRTMPGMLMHLVGVEVKPRVVEILKI